MAFNFFNRFYYGKAGQADYTTERLPATRRALFFEMFKVRFWGLMGVNLLYLIFCLPALIWTVINYMLFIQMGADFMAQGQMGAYLLVMIPCMALAGVGATGEMYVLRNWARDQHAFVLSDFKDAIKGNWKNGLIVGLLNGVVIYMSYVCVAFYGQMARQSVIWLVPQMLVLSVCLVWWMINMLIFPMMVTYDMKLRHMIRNCAIMAIARLPWSVLFLVGSLALPVASVFVPYGTIILLIVYLVMGFGLTGFVYASYANSCFDKFLNPKIEGAQVGRGLRQEDDEDLDDVEDPNPLI